MSTDEKLLFAAYTLRGKAIRIIPARKAQRKETKNYEER
jgi:uncharacterized DUF497 family protein